MTLRLGPGTLWTPDPDGQWHSVGWAPGFDVAAAKDDRPLRASLTGRRTLTWTLGKRSTRAVLDLMWPGARWRYHEGPRARRAYDRRRRARRRRR